MLLEPVLAVAKRDFEQNLSELFLARENWLSIRRRFCPEGVLGFTRNLAVSLLRLTADRLLGRSEPE